LGLTGGVTRGLCGLVVKVQGYRFRGPGSVPGATRFFLRSNGSGTGLWLLNWVVYIVTTVHYKVN
jgi:hypothetical protein